MTFDSALQSVTALFPAGWSGELRLGVLAGLATGVLIALAFVVSAVFRRKPEAGLAASIAAAVSAPVASADLDPEEWISGNVIHLDRQKAFGFIRCDRVKAPVRFEIPAGRLPPPRIGEAVRFKGRHGARRRAVAVLVEPVAKARKAC